MTILTLTKAAPPACLLAFWKEIDDKTFGAGFDCFAVDATCRLGVAEWHGREQIRANLRTFIDTGFTASHDVKEYWDGGAIKIFHGIVIMTPDDGNRKIVRRSQRTESPDRARHCRGVGHSAVRPEHPGTRADAAPTRAFSRRGDGPTLTFFRWSPPSACRTPSRRRSCA